MIDLRYMWAAIVCFLIGHDRRYTGVGYSNRTSQWICTRCGQEGAD